jgi:hypothetical protein
MGARENLQKLADRKAQEITDLERQIDMARAYLQAIQDAIRSLPKEPQANVVSEERSTELRTGSLLAKARDAIATKGAPMHVAEILIAIGQENTKNNRVSLVGSLGAYVRKGAVFTRPAPNTFGLVGMKSPETEVDQPTLLPETFGNLDEGEA